MFNENAAMMLPKMIWRCRSLSVNWPTPQKTTRQAVAVESQRSVAGRSTEIGERIDGVSGNTTVSSSDFVGSDRNPTP